MRSHPARDAVRRRPFRHAAIVRPPSASARRPAIARRRPADNQGRNTANFFLPTPRGGLTVRHRLLPRHFSPPRASGPNRRLYLPAGLLDPNADVPSYLDGTLAGDYGFDPLGLGKDGNIEKYRVAEVIHARWAMLAIPGIVIPEALGIPGGVWTETGKVFLDGEAGRPEILGNPYLFTAIEVALMAGVEGFRSGKIDAPEGFAPSYGKFSGSDFSGLDPINPGGPLDFLNVAATPEDLAVLKVKEIKNGRLAMIAMLGVFVQGAVTNEGPAANWGKHVADPFGYNFVTLSAVDRTPVL